MLCYDPLHPELLVLLIWTQELSTCETAVFPHLLESLRPSIARIQADVTSRSHLEPFQVQNLSCLGRPSERRFIGRHSLLNCKQTPSEGCRDFMSKLPSI